MVVDNLSVYLYVLLRHVLHVKEHSLHKWGKGKGKGELIINWIDLLFQQISSGAYFDLCLILTLYHQQQLLHLCVWCCAQVAATSDLMVAYVDFFLGGDEKRADLPPRLHQRFPMSLVFGGDGSYMTPFFLHNDNILTSLMSQVCYLSYFKSNCFIESINHPFSQHVHINILFLVFFCWNDCI